MQRRFPKMWRYRTLCFCVYLGIATGDVTRAGGQQPTSSSPSHLHFDVISIRPTRSGANQEPHFSYTPDGYHAHGQTLWSTIMVAYYPLWYKYWRGESMKGGPNWLADQYDIDARVASSDIPAWQAQEKTIRCYKPCYRMRFANAAIWSCTKPCRRARFIT